MKSSSTSVGARVDDAGLGGPLWSPVGGGYDPFIDEPMSSGSPRRAIIKAHHPSTQPPSPLQNTGLGLRLMRITSINTYWSNKETDQYKTSCIILKMFEGKAGSAMGRGALNVSGNT